jgi:hypothetical protein
MDSTYPPEAWQRLGKDLERRRAQLGYGYRQREDFLRDRGGPPPSVKTIGRLERGERPGYPESTITLLEQMYGVEPGSFETVLRGGSLEPLSVTEGTIDPSLQAARARADTSDPDTAPDVLFPADPVRQDMWRVITDPGMPVDEKLAALAGPALFPGDRAKQAIVAADIIGREKPAEMAAKIRVLDRMRAEARGRSVHSEQSA